MSFEGVGFALMRYNHLILTKIVVQLCAGLKHMHNLDPPYAHNDVKPGNVLLTHRKGQPPLAILMDFGSARPARKQIRSRSEALQLQVCTMLVYFIWYIALGLLMFSDVLNLVST